MTEQNESGIRIDHRGDVAVITIDQAKRRNAMSRAMRQGLRDAVAGVMEAADKSRAIVLTGAGEHFSAGADISEMGGRRTLPQSREILTETCEAVRSIVGGAKPVIAAVEGIAFGLGFSFACASDYVVASREARFCAAFMRIGLVPDTGILWSLPQKVGPAKARELLALATEIDAEEAARIGVVDRLTEPGKALDEAVAWAQTFADYPPVAMALIKAGLTRGNHTLDNALNTEIDYQGMARITSDHREAVRALADGRTPGFIGQ